MNGHTSGEANLPTFILSQPEDMFHIDPLWDRGTKVLLNDLDIMTKKAAKLIYGKSSFTKILG